MIRIGSNYFNLNFICSIRFFKRINDNYDLRINMSNGTWAEIEVTPDEKTNIEQMLELTVVTDSIQLKEVR